MFGLPREFAFGQMKGVKLLQICIGMHDIIFNFTDGISISVNSAIEIGSDNFERYVDFGTSIYFLCD